MTKARIMIYHHKLQTSISVMYRMELTILRQTE